MVGSDLGISGRAGGGTVTASEAGCGSASNVEAAQIERVKRVRWLIWSVLAFAYLIVLFHRFAPAVVADRLMAEFAAGGTVVGILTSIYFYVYAAMQIPGGALSDALGARKTVAVGASLAGLGSLVFGLAPVLEVAYLGRFLVGLGVSVVFVATLKFQVDWFRAAEFGTVSGLLMLVGNVGSVTATTPVALMAQWFGWRASFIVIGVVTCGVALAAWRWVRDRPSDLGLPPLPGTDAEEPTQPRSARNTRNAREPKIVAAFSFASCVSWFMAAGVVWRNRQTRAGFLAHFGLFGGNLTFCGLWAVPYLMHVYGMDRSEAANYVLVASLAILVSAPLAGYLSDRVLRSRRLPIVFLGMLACAFWLTMTLWNGGRPPVWSLYPLFGLLGVAGGVVTLILTSVKEANPPELAGLAIGTANGAFLSAALLQPAVGYLLDGYWQGAMLEGARVYPAAAYQVMLAVLAGTTFLGLLGAASMKETYSGGEHGPA